MSIRPLNKHKWVIDYYPLGRKGKRVRLTFNGTEAEAKIFETELRRQHAGLPNPVNPKVIDIIPEYLEWLKIHRAKKTYDDIFECLKRILPHFGHLQIRMITPSVINKYKEKRIGRVCACNKELTYLSTIISWMAKHEPPYANTLPFRIEKIPYKKPLPRVPSIKDIERFLKEIKEPLKKTMILLMYQTGLRYSDMAFIKWENIDFNEKTIHLIQKGGGEKVIIMTDDIFNVLYPIRKIEGFVFVNSGTGKPFKSIRKMINTACEKAQIKRIRPHLLRHAFGTYALEATGDLRLVQELLGHKDIDSTQIYTHIMTSRKRDGFKKVADYISQKKVIENPDR